MVRKPNLTVEAKGASIENAGPLSIPTSATSYTTLEIGGKNFSGTFYQNRVRLFFVKDAEPTTSDNVSVLEPLEQSTATKLLVPVKALPAVLEELQGFTGNNRKFKIVVELISELGKVTDTVTGGSSTYVEFV